MVDLCKDNFTITIGNFYNSYILNELSTDSHEGSQIYRAKNEKTPLECGTWRREDIVSGMGFIM